MSVKTKNQPVTLNKVVLDTVIVDVKVDGRKNNPGRPVNKQSARYKRLAKQTFYTKQNQSFVRGKSFNIPNVIAEMHYSKNADTNITSSVGSIFNELGNHVCDVNYNGRTKVTGYTFVLDKRVSVEVNLKNVKFNK